MNVEGARLTGLSALADSILDYVPVNRVDLFMPRRSRLFIWWTRTRVGRALRIAGIAFGQSLAGGQVRVVTRRGTWDA